MPSANLSAPLNSILPGFGKNAAGASNLVRELLSGKLSTGEKKAITDYGAERGTAGGMPGSTGSAGSLFANNDLRTLGLASGARQQQGIQEFLSLLQGVSGTVIPTAGQEIQNSQFNQDLGFRNTQANRNYGLQQNEQDLSAAKFNEQFGPRFTGTIGPGGSPESGGFYTNNRGVTSPNASALMFKYRR